MSSDDVTDRAVLTYLENVYGVDVGGLKRRIGDLTEFGREKGASAVCVDGVRYRLDKKGRVTGVAGKHTALSKRAKRWHRRRG